MISALLYQENGSRKSQNRFSSTHDRSGEVTSISGTRQRSNLGPEPANKRFKPNTTGPRTRISFDGAEETFRSDSTTSSKTGTVCTSIERATIASLQNHGSSTGSENSHSAKEGGVSGTTEEEDSEEEGSKPLRGSNDKNLNNNNPSLYGDLQRSESATSTSPVSSPLTTAMKPCDIDRDLSLGHEDSADSASTKCSIDSSASQPKVFDEKGFLEEVKNDALKKGFTCLSTKCPAADTFLTFRCAEGHIFTTKEFGVTREIACFKCQKLLDKCIEYAKSHNGTDFSLVLYCRNMKPIIV